MKEKTACFFVLITAIILISSCSPGAAVTALQTPEPALPITATVEPAPEEGGAINVWSLTSEVTQMIDKYIKLHPDFRYTVYTSADMADSLYEPPLDEALAAGGPEAPDIYVAEASFVTKYTQDEMSGYALPYEHLGIDVDSGIKEAGTLKYIVDIGTRPSDSAVVALAYQSTGGAFIYRRSIAKEVWGTDDPAAIAGRIGPGWDKFFEAAEDLKIKGYCIVSGEDDIWRPMENSADKGWIAGGKLYIDPKREAYLDYCKELADNGYSNGTRSWTEEWYNDMAGAGPLPVFGFFGPAWFINYVMAGHSGAGFDTNGKFAKAGGTWGDWAVCEPTEGFFYGGMWVLANKELENDPAKKAAVAELIDWITLQCDVNSLQYGWANGTLYGFGGTKDTAASGTVMAMSDGRLPFLGGQDMYGVFARAAESANVGGITRYDDTIGIIWRGQVRKYAYGECTREEAIAMFRQEVKEQLGIEAW